MQHGLLDSAFSRMTPGASCSPRCCGPALPQHRRSRHPARSQALQEADQVADTGSRATLERLYLWSDEAPQAEHATHSRQQRAVKPPRAASSSRPQPLPLGTPMMEDWAASSSVFRVSLQDKPKVKEEKAADYYANVGDAIRTLRDDVPMLFERDLNYDIYREDITFTDPMNKFEGIKKYKTLFWSLRFHGSLFFSKLFVEVKRIWQPPTDDTVIKMRWTVRGIPRVPWEAQGIFDGISTYKLDSHGRVYEHNVDNLLLRDPPFAPSKPLLMGLNLIPMDQQQPAPIPGLYPAVLASGWWGISWCRLYVALCVSVLLNSSLCAEAEGQPATEGQ